jgi:hypothetical protein
MTYSVASFKWYMRALQIIYLKIAEHEKLYFKLYIDIKFQYFLETESVFFNILVKGSTTGILWDERDLFS